MNVDVVVAGGGHAGIEAVNIAARAGVSSMLVTPNIEMIGQMSCNPAIGGVSKGNIVREVDALGGLMGKAADRAGIQFRMLNKSKGMAVWGNRAQADKVKYRTEIRKLLEQNSNCYLYQGMVVEVIKSAGKAEGVVLETGEKIFARAVILAMGTFLNGRAYIGDLTISCGRLGEQPSLKLSENIQKLGIKAGRLKTGTPQRIDGRSVNYEALEVQEGDEFPQPFSYSTEVELTNRARCWTAKTNRKTHEVIKKNLKKSALYGGRIKSVGPRYCPSIEDKIVRFGERNGHTLFLEPESLDNNEMYLNGFSTSLPLDVQEKMLKTVKGFEDSKVIKPAYAIEYDYFYPVQLYPTCESKIIEGLYFTGQINGTSGYEEAACQGIIAGINAAAGIKGEDKFIPGRDVSYSGVLLDDLTTRGTDEPYRMFTSRAEYRLLLRQDNSDERLMPLAYKRGLIDREIYERRKLIWEEASNTRKRLEKLKISPGVWEKTFKKEIREKKKASALLKMPDVHIDDVLKAGNVSIENREVRQRVEADIKYEGFVKKQKLEIEHQKRMETFEIPKGFDYDCVEGLLLESKNKMKKIMPATIGQASRIQGVTPADISVLLINLSKGKNVSRETVD